MADISKRTLDCDDDERGKRGKRGRQGPPGPASGGLLKFSGPAAVEPESQVVSFLADSGAEGASAQDDPLGYPVAVAHNLRNMAVNIGAFVVPLIVGSIIIELIKNGGPLAVPGFTITYGPGGTGIMSVLAGPELFAIEDTFDLRVTTFNVGSVEVEMSATVGVE